MTMTNAIPPTVLWYALSAAATEDYLNTDADHGLSADEAKRRLGLNG